MTANSLEEGKYLAYSLKAVQRLLPCLEQGEAFMTARKSVYPETFRPGLPVVGQFAQCVRISETDPLPVCQRAAWDH
jgi:hypothetical protein